MTKSSTAVLQRAVRPIGASVAPPGVSDQELLRRLTGEKYQAAFAALVRR